MTRYLLDTTVLVAHLRGDEAVTGFMLDLMSRGHALCTSCIIVAEIERGVRPRERGAVTALLDRLTFLVTTKEAAIRAGEYLAEYERRGRPISPMPSSPRQPGSTGPSWSPTTSTTSRCGTYGSSDRLRMSPTRCTLVGDTAVAPDELDDGRSRLLREPSQGPLGRGSDDELPPRSAHTFRR